MATYNYVPKTKNDIKTIKFHDSRATDILLFIFDNFKRIYGFDWKSSEPVAAQKVKANDIKFRRAYGLDKLRSAIEKSFPFTISQNKNSITIKDGRQIVLKISHGEGSRNRKAGGGKSGKAFENDLASDLMAFSDDSIRKKHPNIVKEIAQILKNEYKIDLSKDRYFVEVEGGKNQKRTPKWNKGQGLYFIPSGNIGHIVTDVTVTSGNKKAFLSLKYTSQYYIVNATVAPYLHFNDKNNNEQRNEILKYFGFNPKAFCNGYGLGCDDETMLSESRIKANWKKILEEVIGFGYIYVVGGGKHDIVLNANKKPSISVVSIEDRVYAVPNVRKYSKIGITVRIDGRLYKMDCQFRGTTATDKYPRYLRVLVKG